MDEIVGRNPVFEALRAGRKISKLVIIKGAKGNIIRDIKKLALAKGLAYKEVDRFTFEGLTSLPNHQGILAFGKPLKQIGLNDLLVEKPNLLLALDQIQDPQNLGSIIRTAAFMGVQGVIYTKHHSANLTAAAVKAAAGGVEWVPLVQITNLATAMERLKDKGFWIVGGDDGAEEIPDCVDFTYPTLLVIGSEGTGLRRLIREKCDHLVAIPQIGPISSLNASVATGIFLYEVNRQRGWEGSQLRLKK